MRALYSFILVLTLATFAARAADDPVEVDASDDTWLSSDYTGKAQKRGSVEEMQIYGKSDDTANRALIKFDLKKAPAGFKSAILRLTAYNFAYSENRTAYLRCHPLLTAWTEESATWDIRNGKMTWQHVGGDFDPKPASGYSFTGPLGGGAPRDLYFDVTAAAQAWQAQPGKNEGVAVFLQKGCTAEIRVRTHEFATEMQRPKLLLYYQKPAQKMAAVIPGDQLPPYEPLDPAAPSVNVGSHGELKVNEAFEIKFSASGAKDPYTYVLASPAVPGLNLTPDGVMKGKPSRAGVYIVGVTCMASNNKKSTLWDRFVVIDPNAPAPKPPVAVADKPKDPAAKDPPKVEEKKKSKEPTDE